MDDRAEFLRKVGGRIRDYRIAQGLSQGELARKIGKSQNMISRYESGERELGITELRQIADELGLFVSHLLGETFIEDELDVANQILIPSLKLSAQMTLYRHLKMHKSFGELMDERLKEYGFRLNAHEIEETLFRVRESTLQYLEGYLTHVVDFSMRFIEHFPDLDRVLPPDIHAWRFHAPDIVELMEDEKRSRDDL